MITVKCSNDATDQEMVCSIDVRDDRSVSISFEFIPEVDTNSKDSYGIMGCIMNAITDHFGDNNDDDI